MTAAQERPAGRLACGARPAGALSAGRGTGAPSTDPRIIRAVLEHADAHTLLAAATRYGVALRTVTRWRARAEAAAAAGVCWPSDADVAYWVARQPTRVVNRARLRSFRRRRVLAGGPLFIDATGTTRRMQALSALGWRYEDLAAELEVTAARVGYLTVGRSPQVHRDTAATVAALYDRLAMTPGPSAETRSRAAARGWAPPLAWDDDTIDDPAARPRRTGDRRAEGLAFDEVAVARAIHGDAVHLRPAERAEAVRQLTARGLSATAIAERLRTTSRSVTRHRTAEPTRRSA